MRTLVSLALAGALALSGCGQQPLWPRDPDAAGVQPAPPRQPDSSAAAVEPPAPAPAPEPAPKPVVPEKKRVTALSTGITAYEDGKYREATKALRTALASPMSIADQVQAHKYLAFIECSSNRTKQCRDEFRKALKLDPSFELEPAESGHPVWGPIFRTLKKTSKR